MVIVCCGGGGLLSGVAAGIKLKGADSTRIIGVEPEGGDRLCIFWEFFKLIFLNRVEKFLFSFWCKGW